MSFDLGIQKRTGNFDDDKYKVFYLSDLKLGEKIVGELHISDLREEEYNGKSIQKFYLIITNHLREIKWVCSINTSVYRNQDVVTIYGARGGRVYGIIDSLMHCLNGTNLNEEKSYTVVFDVFRNNINEKIGLVTVKAVKSFNINAKTPNLEFIKATPLNGNMKTDIDVKGNKEDVNNMYS
jgi:hypothetical protein